MCDATAAAAAAVRLLRSPHSLSSMCHLGTPPATYLCQMDRARMGGFVDICGWIYVDGLVDIRVYIMSTMMSKYYDLHCDVESTFFYSKIRT